jgi:hypothetical protein
MVVSKLNHRSISVERVQACLFPRGECVVLLRISATPSHSPVDVISLTYVGPA